MQISSQHLSSDQQPKDGVLTMTDVSLTDAPASDVLFVPGGLGTRQLQHDDARFKSCLGPISPNTSQTMEIKEII